MPLVYQNPGGDKMFDVEKGVGVNSPNQPPDVKLVQYMLREIYAAGFSTPPTNKPLAVDSQIGPITISWITQFQKDVNSKGHLYSNPEKVPASGAKCAVDGRVDAMTNPSAKGRISNLYYTISWLNTILKKLNRKAFEKIPTVVPCTPSTPSTRPNPYNPVPAPFAPPYIPVVPLPALPDPPKP